MSFFKIISTKKYQFPILLLLSIFLLSTPVNAASWEVETIDNSSYVGTYASLDFDSSGNPCVGYWDGSTADLKYTYYNDSGWQFETVDSGGNVGQYASLAIDSSDHIGISYYDNPNSNLKYAYYNGSSWQIETVDSSGGVGYYTSVAFNLSGNPGISYYDWSNDDLKYAHHNGSGWQIETVDSSGDVGSYSSLAFDLSGNPCISYSDGMSNFNLKYAHYNGSSWQLETVDNIGNVGRYTSLAFNSSGRPGISYYDWSNNDLKYAHHNGSSWQLETVDSTGDVGQYTSLSFDTFDKSCISYFDGTNSDLKYARYTGSSWQTETVDSIGDVGQHTSLSFDSSNDTAISYYDTGNNNLKYAILSSTGTLSVNSSVPDAWVYVDGVNKSVQTNTTLNYEAGTYNVTVIKEYYETPVNQSITIAGSNSSVEFLMMPISLLANFTAIPISGTAPLNVSFIDFSSNSPEMWNLSFGDGSWHNTTDSSLVNTTHLYSSAGNFTAILSVSARGLSNTSSTNISVAGSLPVNSSVSGAWVYVDGVNQSVQTNTTLTLAAGTYDITVIKYLYETPANQSVTINGSNPAVEFIMDALAPVANFSTTPISGTVPLNVSFTDLSTGVPEMWNLSFGDGSWHNTTDASLVNTTHLYSSTGKYTATLNVSSRGLSDSTSTMITVNAVSTSSGISSRGHASISQGQNPEIVVDTVSSVIRVIGGAGVNYDFSASDTPVVSVSFDAKKDAGLVVSKVQVLSTSSAGVPSPSSISYKMMSIDVGSEDTISTRNADNLLIHFKVSREWIEEDDIDVSTIRMTRYHDEKWNDLPTFQEREEDDFIYFTAETPGFSIFEIVGDKIGENVVEEEAEMPASVEEKPESTKTRDTPGFTGLAGISVVSLAFLVSRKMILE